MDRKYKEKMVIGDCVLREFLGRGAFAEVWKAFSTSREEEVTIKIGLESGAEEAFIKEHEMTSSLPEKITPRAIEVDITNDPPYLLRQWSESQTLRTVISQKSPLELEKALELCLQFSQTLDELHDKNIAHGDLKPENILVNKDNSIQFIDFAGAQGMVEEGDLLLSQDLRERESSAQHGTLLYLAPEVREGKAEVDQPSDIYSAGLILFEILTGRRPQGLELPGEVREDLPSYFNKLIQNCLAPRKRRHFHGKEVFNELKEMVERYEAGDLGEDHLPRYGLWNVLTGKRPTSFTFRGALYLMCVLIMGCFIDMNSYVQQRMALHLGIFGAFTFAFIYAANLFPDNWSRWTFSNWGGLAFFIGMVITFGATNDYYENLRFESRKALWQKYKATLSTMDNTSELESLFLPQKKKELLRIHRKKIRKDLGGLRRVTPYSNEREEFTLDKNKCKLNVKLVFEKGKIRGEVIFTDTRPWTPRGKWLISNVDYYVEYDEKPKPRPKPDPKPEEKPSQPARLSDFKKIETNTVNLGGKTVSLSVYLHKDTGMKFTLVPAGSYQRGDRENKHARPVKEVAVNSFLISQTEVTQGAWKKVMATEPWQGKEHTQFGPSFPAVYITWDGARMFASRVGMRLPTETEWEYAARAGESTDYYWGKEMDPAYGWYGKNSKSFGHAMPVGKKIPNNFLLSDTSGNVWEWCGDHWSWDYTDRGSHLYRKKEGNRRVIRGGSWNSPAERLTSWFRRGEAKGAANSETGFRLAVSWPLDK